MKRVFAYGGLFLSLVVCLPLSSCRKAEEVVADELEAAGFALTVEDWMRACEDGEEQAVRRFLDAGFDVATVDEAGDTGAHAAARGGSEAVFAIFLSRGVEIDVRGANDRTPLMSAVLADQAEMVRWLVRQGADVRLRDGHDFSPLMLAVREGRREVVEELATPGRQQLDDALLLAGLLGRAEVIDTLTSFGASVFARMNDGRTALMLAAENGHMDAVEMLIDLGSSRFSTDDEGRTAMDMAAQAGFPDVQMIMERSSREVSMRLDAEEDLIQQMTAYVDLAAGGATTRDEDEPRVTHEPTVLLSDAVISPGVAATGDGVVAPPDDARHSALLGAATGGESIAPPSAPPALVMRHYQQRELPIRVMRVEGETAVLEISQDEIDDFRVAAGEVIPQTTVEVVRVGTRLEQGKLFDGEPVEVAYVEVRDRRGGASRTWLEGQPAMTHDPAALVEDAATGRRYLALPGQRFTSEDGRAFVVSDVRPDQMVIVEESTGAAHTLRLRGPRG